MTIVDRHLAGTFVRSYLILIVLGMGLYVVIDLIVNLDEFTENRDLAFAQVLAAMASYYGYNLPLYFSQLAGPVLAFAGAYTVAMMLRNHEMTALVAAGMPLQRLAVPLLGGAVLLSGLWIANRELVLPRYAAKIARHRDDITGTRTAGIEFARDDRNVILRARRVHLQEGRLDYVVLVEADAQGMPTSVIQADAAVYDPQRRTWRLEAGRRIDRSHADAGALDEGITREPIQEYPFTLAPEELILRQSSGWAGMLSLRQMNALLKSRNLPNLAAVQMERHVWLTEPLLQFLLLALTIPFFLTREPASVLAAGGRALLLAGAFAAVAFLSRNAASPQWAALLAWIPILLFGPVAVLMLANVKT
jgi:lipopolysaccharide export LptBFGC system permease protein LptF